MALNVLCIPCQFGDHDNHYEVVQAVPEGTLGGARCPCEGECVGTAQPDLGLVPAQDKTEGGEG